MSCDLTVFFKKYINFDALNVNILFYFSDLKQSKMTVTTLIEKLIAFMQNPKDNRRRFVVLDFIDILLCF